MCVGGCMVCAWVRVCAYSRSCKGIQVGVGWECVNVSLCKYMTDSQL